jgi:hypothetical protein
MSGRNSLERLSEMHPPRWEERMQTTWGGNWFPHRRKPQGLCEPSTPGRAFTCNSAKLSLSRRV